MLSTFSFVLKSIKLHDRSIDFKFLSKLIFGMRSNRFSCLIELYCKRKPSTDY
jgi:hypothetical protein